MKLFVVVRLGVYVQGIGGIFSDRAAAEAAAEVLESEEPDSYHKFKVKDFTLGETRRDYENIYVS